MTTPGGQAMNRMISRAVTLAGTLAIAGGVAAATALPAAAAGPNFAFGSAAAGAISSPPLGVAIATPFQTTVSHNVSIPGILGTGTAFATAGPTSAFSKVTNGTSTLPKIAAPPKHAPKVTLTATLVTAQCQSDTPSVGFTSIGGGWLTVGAAPPYPLPQHPAANRVISIPGNPGT